MGLWFAGMSRQLGSDSGGGLGASVGVDTWEWVSIPVLDVPLDMKSGASCVWSSGARGSRCLCCQRRGLWFWPRNLVSVVVVLRFVLRCVAVVRVWGTVLRVVLARGTPTRCGVCDLVCGSFAVVSAL